MSNTQKQNEIEFLNSHKILWFPIEVDMDKKINKDKYKDLPQYEKNPVYPTKAITGYYPKNNDFQNLDKQVIIDRQKYVDKCNYIAIDTRDIHHIDIDMLDKEKYKTENYDFIKDIITKLPYYRSLSCENGKKQGKHLFFKTDVKIKTNTKQTKYKDIEIMCGQWAWMKKTQQIICPINYNMNFENIENILETKETKQTKKPTEKKKRKLVIKPTTTPTITTTPTTTIKDKFSEIKELCNIIDLKYIDSYHSWIRIVWGLKFISEDLKDFAITLSKKSTKFNQEGFDNVWDNTSYEGITKSTIYYYSKKSNITEFKKIIRNYYLDDTDNNYAETFIKYETDNLVFKNSTPYIFIKNTWYKQDKECNQLQAIITKVLSEIITDLMIELTKKLGTEQQRDEPDEDIINNLRIKIDTNNKMLRGIRSATGSKNICKKVIHQLSIIDFENIEFDNCPDILPFKTQYYDLNKNTLNYYKANDFILTKLSYDYKKSTTEQYNKIDNLFNQIFTNKDICNDYKNILATTLFGRPVDKFIIANGNGGNGKSVLHELLIEALEEGVFAYVAPVSVILNKIKQGNNPEVASMNNKRFVVYREPAENEMINIGTLKELTGSKSINARMNYSNDTKTILKATHILEANKKPKMKGEMDNSIYRRLIDIAFNSTFTFDKEMIQEHPDNHFLADGKLRTQLFRDDYKCAFINYLIVRNIEI